MKTNLTLLKRIGIFLSFLVINACEKEVLPTLVRSGVVSDITGNTAKVTGSVTAIGTESVSDHGIVYGTTSTPTINDTKISLGTLSSPKDFSSDLNGLSQNTAYSFRAYAINASGTIYGDVINFKTLELRAPTSTTGISTGITLTSFTMDGKLTDIGTSNVTEFGHCISATNQAPTTADTKTMMGVASAAKDFKSVFTSLKNGTIYYVRSYATNAIGTSYGEKVDVKTVTALAPTVSTGVASAVLTNSATVNGSLKTMGTDNVTQHGHVWSSTSLNPTTADSKTTLGALESLKDFSSGLTGLVQGTSYNVRSYATNSVGTSYGEVVVFKTINAELPTVLIYTSVQNILSSSAKVSGVIEKSGSTAVIQYGHVYSSTNQTPTTADSKTVLTAGGNFPLDYKSDLNNLTPNTTYYVRAYATSSSGTGYTKTVISFKTGDAGSELKVIKGVTLSGKTGNKYTDLDQNILLNLATGKTYLLSEGNANSNDIDLILTLYSNKDKIGTGYEDVILYSPSGLLNYNKYWGNIGEVLSSLDWPVYKGTKINFLSITKYDPLAWWDKLNSVTDLTTIVSNEYIGFGSQEELIDNKGNINDDRIYIFKTKEGKTGIFKITNANKKQDTYTVTIDIKVQK